MAKDDKGKSSLENGLEGGSNKGIATNSDHLKDTVKNRYGNNQKDKDSPTVKDKRDVKDKENEEKREEAKEKEKEKEEEKSKVKDGFKKQAKKAARKGATVGGTKFGQFLLLSKAMDIAQTAIGMAANLIQNLGSILWGLAKAGVHAIGSFISGLASSLFGGLVGAISSIFSIGTTAATITAASLLAGSLFTTTVAVLGAISAYQTELVTKLDGVHDCGPDARAAIAGANADIDKIDIGAKQLEVAQKVYAVLNAIGIPDVNIAGCLGNFQAESALDPTVVERIGESSNEPFRIGPTKQAAENEDFLAAKIVPDYKRDHHLIVRLGIGLAQCSDTEDGATENTQLRNAAKQLNKHWWDLDLQLALYISVYSRAKWLRGWTTPASSPEEAAFQFAKNFEGNTTMAQADRKKYSANWFVRIKDFKKDESYANSVMAMAKDLGVTAISASATNAVDRCVKASVGGRNDSLAHAWASYAYPNQREGWGNDGTALYQQLHREIYPGDPWFQSCDRSVAVGVRWSGTDDHFPPGNCEALAAYMATSPKWEKVDTQGIEKNYQPGDILVLAKWPKSEHGHILGYTGHQALVDIFKDKVAANANSVSGSYMERSPGAGAVQPVEFKMFTVYRSKGKEANSKYTKLGGGTASLGAVAPGSLAARANNAKLVATP